MQLDCAYAWARKACAGKSLVDSPVFRVAATGLQTYESLFIADFRKFSDLKSKVLGAVSDFVPWPRNDPRWRRNATRSMTTISPLEEALSCNSLCGIRGLRSCGPRLPRRLEGAAHARQVQ